MAKYEAKYIVSYNNGNGYSGQGSERKKLHIKADDRDIAYDRAREQLARIRKGDSVKSVTLEGIVQIRK